MDNVIQKLVVFYKPLFFINSNLAAGSLLFGRQLPITVYYELILIAGTV